jgi:hypothetical protein
MPFYPKRGKGTMLAEFDLVLKLKDKWVGLNDSGEVFASSIPLKQKKESSDAVFKRMTRMAESMYNLAFDEGYMKAKQEQMDYMI